MGGFLNLNQSWSKDGYQQLVKRWDGNDPSLKPEKKLKGDLNDPVVQEMRMVEALSSHAKTHSRINLDSAPALVLNEYEPKCHLKRVQFNNIFLVKKPKKIFLSSRRYQNLNMTTGHLYETSALSDRRIVYTYTYLIVWG